MSDDKEITYKINNAEYRAKFILKTEGENSEEILFSKSAIRGMDIEENFLNPFTTGNIYINNPLDFIEDGALIRGDGRDTFTIEFYPVDPGEGEGSNKNFNASGNQEGGPVKLKYEFVISSEVNSASKTDRLNNFKTYSLLEKSYFKLNERIPYGKRYRGKVGAIIKNILEQFDIPVNSLEWEEGEMVIDALPEHILPPSTFRYSDLINYLLKLNYKKVMTPYGFTYVRIVLNYCRICQEYKYKALSDIFDGTQAPIEGFLANDLVDKMQSNPNNPAMAAGKTPHNKYNAALQNSDLSSPMLFYTNAFLNNMLVSSYSPILGEHLIKLLRISDIKKKWKTLFVDTFKYEGGKPQPWLVLNKVKSNELFRPIGFPLPDDHATPLAEAELTANMTFFNLQLNFDTLGNVDRQPGEFIEVSSTRPNIEDDAENPFGGKEVQHRSDAKLLGTWFVTKVRHEFHSAKVDGYTNILQCIKPHIGPSPAKPSDCVD